MVYSNFENSDSRCRLFVQNRRFIVKHEINSIHFSLIEFEIEVEVGILNSFLRAKYQIDSFLYPSTSEHFN